MEYWAEIMYGGKKIKSHSNIIFRYVIDTTVIRTEYSKYKAHLAVVWWFVLCNLFSVPC